ncbi:DNA recombination protein RmuC [Propionibacteriaceae bacterium Y2011]
METATATALVIGLLLGALLGAAACWWLLRSRPPVANGDDVPRQRAEAEAARQRAEAEAGRARDEASQSRLEATSAREAAERARADTAELRAELAGARTETAQAMADRSDVSATLAGVRASLSEATRRADDAEQRARTIAEDREALAKEFKVLSAATLESQGKQAERSADQRLKATEQLMAPVTESLRQLQERLTAVEKERASLATDLRNQVRTVQSTGEHLRRETHALVTALRKPQIRGNWGEMQLKNAAELANMRQHCDFDLQHTTTTTGGTGIRPDMRVNLSDGKYVFVDSKVPLESFLDAHDTDDEDRREAALQRYGKVVKGHVDQLSGKQYWAVDDHTPEFVIMFLPSEALAAEALSRMPDLHEYAARKGIVIASPSTLIAMLRTVAHSWKQAALAQNAKEVADLGRELYQRLGTMGGHFDKLGRALQTSVKAYNSTLGSLESRVFVTARRFNDLDVTSEELPSPDQVEHAPRQVTASELVDDAVQATPMIGRERAADTEQPTAEVTADPELPERHELTRGEPDLFDLTDAEQPRQLRRRSS